MQVLIDCVADSGIWIRDCFDLCNRDVVRMFDNINTLSSVWQRIANRVPTESITEPSGSSTIPTV